MDNHIAQVAADLAKATKQHMPAMVVMVHQLRTVYDRIEAQEAEIRSLRERVARYEAVKSCVSIDAVRDIARKALETDNG